MAEFSKIEWTDHTFNPWIGCQHVSRGCDHCYAETMMAKRYGRVEWGPHGERKRTSEVNWKTPLKWNANSRRFDRDRGHRPRVFCASLADVFDNQVPDGWREDLFDLIRACRHLDWLVVTKRPENIAKMLPPDWGRGYGNVWLGMTAEDQKWFDRRWAVLEKIPAAIKFVSYEPALGRLRLPTDGSLPDWIISGGESGGGARPMKAKWVRKLFRDCRRNDVAFFHKQWGTYGNNPLVSEDGLTVDAAKALDPDGKGGALVDGKLVREFPV